MSQDIRNDGVIMRENTMSDLQNGILQADVSMEEEPATVRANVTDLPPEVVVQVFHLLGMTDRLSLLRVSLPPPPKSRFDRQHCPTLLTRRLLLTPPQVSRTFRDIYTGSSTLQYDFALRTSAYLDVPFEHPPEVAASQTVEAPQPSTRDDQVRGRSTARHHTGDSLAHPSVSFPLSFDPPLSERHHKHSRRPLGAAEKAQRLMEREKRWSTLDEKAERQFTVKGRAGVYELQEGVFLMCGDYDEGEQFVSGALSMSAITEDQVGAP